MGHWRLPDSLSLSVVVFWITLGHLDYVFSTYTFRINFGTLDFLESHNIHYLIYSNLFLSWRKETVKF